MSLDLCERVTFEMAPTGTKKPGWRFGDLAAHQTSRKTWSITHLPSGMSLRNGYCWFKTVEQATAAMVEISKLRNSWDFIDVTDEERTRLRDQVREIAERHGGSSPPDGWGENYTSYSSGFNGYEPVSSGIREGK